MEQLKNVLLRICATFAASGLGVIGAGAIAGVAFVVEGLSRAFLDDGKLTLEEINDVFNKVDGKDKDSK